VVAQTCQTSAGRCCPQGVVWAGARAPRAALRGARAVPRAAAPREVRRGARPRQPRLRLPHVPLLQARLRMQRRYQRTPAGGAQPPAVQARCGVVAAARACTAAARRQAARRPAQRMGRPHGGRHKWADEAVSECACRGALCSERGTWCGTCLWTRVGQNLDEARSDPGWRCPPCLDLCNCSGLGCTRCRCAARPLREPRGSNVRRSDSA